MKDIDQNIFHSNRVYQLSSLLGGLVMLVFAVNLSRSFGWDSLLFLFAAGVFTIYNLRWMMTRVELTVSGFTVYEPLQPPTHFEYRQVDSVHESGRLIMGISLIYFPIGDNGLLDIDSPQTLFLPGLERQDQIMTCFRQSMPKGSRMDNSLGNEQ